MCVTREVVHDSFPQIEAIHQNAPFPHVCGKWFSHSLLELTHFYPFICGYTPIEHQGFSSAIHREVDNDITEP